MGRPRLRPCTPAAQPARPHSRHSLLRQHTRTNHRTCGALLAPFPPLLPPQGKLDTEEVLDRSGVNWTSIRPVYIYGPLNYNPVEEFFFHRIKVGHHARACAGRGVRGGVEGWGEWCPRRRRR